MVKIERLQEWVASDKCLSVMGKRLFVILVINLSMRIENLMWNRDIAQHHYILFENGSISY